MHDIYDCNSSLMYSHACFQSGISRSADLSPDAEMDRPAPVLSMSLRLHLVECGFYVVRRNLDIIDL